MKNNNEKQILNIIKYTPPLFIILVSLCITTFLYYDNKRTFFKEKSRIEMEHVQANKEIVKKEVNRVYDYINYLQKTTESELKKSIKNRVYEAHDLALSIYNEYKDTKSKEEIFSLIKIALSSLKYNDGRGYFFADDINGVKVVYPIDKNIEGKSFYHYEDANGYKFVQTIVKTIKEKNERFDEYYWYKPNQGKESFRKISFYKYFEPLNLAIGSGEYIDEYEKQVKQKALEYIDLIRYGKAGYIFVINYDSIYLSHIKKNYVGKSAKTNNDTVAVNEVVSKLIEISKMGEGYYSYIQYYKPGSEKSAKKISYVKGLDSWQWVIGTGFYEDDVLSEIELRKDAIDRKFDSYIKNIMIISSLLTLVLLYISIYISRVLEDKFSLYKKDINKKQTLLYQQSKMAAMGEMIGNIAHQWRQPLSTITTASTGMVLHKQLGTLNDEFFDDATNRINTSAQHLSKTIDDFRNFFSPNKKANTFRIDQTFKTTLDLIQAQFSAKDIHIVKNIESIELNTYENELIQALINILNNARDELIKLDMNKEKIIIINAVKKENNLSISIKDNAGGIPTDILNRVFEPYFTTKHKAQGTGIGLYMTKEIITKHLKGSLLVKNEEFIYEGNTYIGAKFIITLPL